MEPLEITVVYDKVDVLRKAMQIAFAWHSKAVAWAVSPEGALVFYWHAVKDGHLLPVALDGDGAAELALGWLRERPAEAYGRQPDHDGDNVRGFRVSNTGPSMGSDWQRRAYAIVAVSPEWVEYHK